jgi:hypothetical protein
MADEVINYRLGGIELVFKSMNPIPITGVGTQFLFDLRVEIKVHAEHKLVIPFVTIKVSGGEEKIELANIGVSCLFEVEDFEKLIIQNEQGLYTVPPLLEAAVRPIAISTARGVMYSEFRGTYLNNAILPVIYMNSLSPQQQTEAKKVQE